MRVKVCGITRVEDAQEAVRLGAWAVGLNRWPESLRYCHNDAAAEIAAAVKRRCEIVGVFVNASLETVEVAAEDFGLTMVQLHGGEGPAFCQEVSRRTGCRVIKALRVRTAADLRAAEAYRTDFHLLDAYRPGVPGGTGESFDWELPAGRRSRVPLILAGGLTPENVGGAIAAALPFAVDVASGVEAEAGLKDRGLMASFFERTQAASADPTVMAR